MTTKRVSLFLLVLLALVEVSVRQTIATSSAPKLQSIKVYFYLDPGEHIDLSPGHPQD